MNTTQPTVEVINEALAKGAKSMTEIARHLGHKGSISGKLAKQIRELVPDIADRLKSNIGQMYAKKVAEKIANNPKPTGKFRRHPKNPFREGSGYALAFDVLASHQTGVARDHLTNLYAKAARKPLKNASFDIAVLLSPKGESVTSERHKSCREGYGLKRDGNHYQIVLPKSEPS